MSATANDFEMDYATVKEKANSIRTIANNISEQCDNVDKTMSVLYEQNWQSAGATRTNDVYVSELKNRFDGVINSIREVGKIADQEQNTTEQGDKAAETKQIQSV